MILIYKTVIYLYNSTLSSGTNKFKNKYKGTVFSAVQGSSGNNYWHWLFDILPKIEILKHAFLPPDVKRHMGFQEVF